MAETAFAQPQSPGGEILLQQPSFKGQNSLEEALAKRRSIRAFGSEGIALDEISQLLWAGQGITSPAGLRTAPSAGALYPLELFLAAGQVDSLEAGVFRYQPRKHSLKAIAPGDRRSHLSRAALGQAWIAESPAVIAVTAVARRTTAKYGSRGQRYIYMEAGHVAQNVCLQAASLGLATTPVGAFDDDDVKRVLGIAAEAEPIYLLPVGRR